MDNSELGAAADYNPGRNSHGAQGEQHNLAVGNLEVLGVVVRMQAAAVGTDWENEWFQKGPGVAPAHDSLGEGDTE